MDDNMQDTEYEIVTEDGQAIEQYFNDNGEEVVYEEVIVDENGQPIEENSSYVEDNDSVVQASTGQVVEGYSNDDGIVFYKYDDNNTASVVSTNQNNNETIEDNYDNVVYENSNENIVIADDGNDSENIEVDGSSNIVNSSDDSYLNEGNQGNLVVDDSTIQDDDSQNNNSEMEKENTAVEDASTSFIIGASFDNDGVVTPAVEDVVSKDDEAAEQVILGDSISTDSNIKVGAKSVFTEEEKKSLVSDEVSLGIVPNANLQQQPFSATTNIPVMNQANVAVNQPMSTYPTNMVVQQPYLNQPLANQVVPNQYQVPFPAYPQQQYPQPNQAYVNQAAMPMVQTPYQQTIPVASSGVMPPSNTISMQQTFGQVNTPVMYQANSATYATRGIQPMNSVPYNNTGASPMGTMNAYQNTLNKPTTVPSTMPVSSNGKKRKLTKEERKIYKSGFSIFRFLFTIIFLAIAALAVYIFFIRKSNYVGSSDVNAIFDPFKPILMYKDDMAGYMNYKGEVIIDPIYDKATEFYGGYAVVFSNDVYKVINSAGEMQFTFTSDKTPSYDLGYDVWLMGEDLYSGDMVKLASNVKSEGYGFYSYVDQANSMVGVVNNLGEKLYSASGTEILVEYSEAYDNDTYALVKVPDCDDQIISSKAKTTVFTAPANTITNEHEAIFSVNNNGIKKFLYFNDGKLVKEFENVSGVAMYNFKKGILEITKNDTEYYYDTINNAELDEATHDLSSSFDDFKYYGYEKTTCGDEASKKYGLAKENNDIFTCEYDDVQFLSVVVHEFVKRRTLREYVILTKGNNVQLYDLTLKKVILDLDDVEYRPSEYSPFVVFGARKDSNAKEDIVYSLLTGKSLSFNASDEYYYTNGTNYFIAFDKDNKATFYNIKLKNIYEIPEFLR